MDDLINSGPQREPGLLARHATAAVIVAVLVVLAVVAIRHLPRPADAAKHHPASAVASGPVQLAGLGPAAARLLNGDRPAFPPGRLYGRYGRALARCSHEPGNHDFQLAGLAACPAP